MCAEKNLPFIIAAGIPKMKSFPRKRLLHDLWVGLLLDRLLHDLWLGRLSFRQPPIEIESKVSQELLLPEQELPLLPEHPLSPYPIA